jgi:hypothetical protein
MNRQISVLTLVFSSGLIIACADPVEEYPGSTVDELSELGYDEPAPTPVPAVTKPPAPPWYEVGDAKTRYTAALAEEDKCMAGEMNNSHFRCDSTGMVRAYAILALGNGTAPPEFPEATVDLNRAFAYLIREPTPLGEATIYELQLQIGEPFAKYTKRYVNSFENTYKGFKPSKRYVGVYDGIGSSDTDPFYCTDLRDRVAGAAALVEAAKLDAETQTMWYLAAADALLYGHRCDESGDPRRPAEAYAWYVKAEGGNTEDASIAAVAEADRIIAPYMDMCGYEVSYTDGDGQEQKFVRDPAADVVVATEWYKKSGMSEAARNLHFRAAAQHCEDNNVPAFAAVLYAAAGDDKNAARMKMRAP